LDKAQYSFFHIQMKKTFCQYVYKNNGENYLNASCSFTDFNGNSVGFHIRKHNPASFAVGLQGTVAVHHMNFGYFQLQEFFGGSRITNFDFIFFVFLHIQDHLKKYFFANLGEQKDSDLVMKLLQTWKQFCAKKPIT
jgi:hypothetical protein